VEFAAPSPAERWLDVACGPGIVSRALRGARRGGPWRRPDSGDDRGRTARGAAAGLANVTFAVGDRNALEWPEATSDGGGSTLRDPSPAAALAAARRARPRCPTGGGSCSPITSPMRMRRRAWALELERLRDTSHWAALPLGRLRALGAATGLELERERVTRFSLDFDDWLARGSGGAWKPVLIEGCSQSGAGGSGVLPHVARRRQRKLDCSCGCTLEARARDSTDADNYL